MKAILIRTSSDDQGTFGHLVAGDFHCRTGELPWRDNHHLFSCIPPGGYLCEKSISPKFKECFKLQNVPDRQDILIHAGNWCGDVTAGFKTDTEGCIILGDRLGEMDNQKALMQSKIQFNRLLLLMPVSFWLQIIDNIEA